MDIINGKMINLLRKLKYVINEYAQLCMDYVYHLVSFSSQYEFNDNDVVLYFKERKRAAVDMHITDASNGMKLITINDTKIYWPGDASCADLPWVWNEVYAPFADNPASYDHPLMDYGSRDWIIDAGSSEGYFALFVLPRLKSGARLIVVEPLSFMRDSLERTMYSASGSQFDVVQSALGSINSKTFLQVDTNHICCSKVASNDSIEQSVSEEVEITTLDSLSESIGLHGSGVVKMDIEGYEMEALKGAKGLLRSAKPALAIAVYHDYKNAMECANIIRAANPTYQIEFRGWYGYKKPPRPYLLFAY